MGRWACSECGCDYDEAQAKRRRRGEPPIHGVRTAACSFECQSKRLGRQYAARLIHDRGRYKKRAAELRHRAAARRRP